MENKKQDPAKKSKSSTKPRSRPVTKSKPAPASRPQTASASKPKTQPSSRPKPAPARNPKTEDPEEVRLMKVKMRKSEFDKFDRGETHSQKGIRDEKGKLSALPDVESVSEEDLPVRTVVQKQEPCVKDQMLEAGAQAFGEVAGEVVGELIRRAFDYAVDKVTDPELYRTIGRKTKQIWNESVKPTVQAAQDRRKEKKGSKKTQLQTEVAQAVSSEVSDSKAQDQTTFIASEEQASLLIQNIRAEAQDLAEKIYILSRLTIKSEKSEAEWTLEQSYIKELMAEETKKVIKLAASHPEQVGEKVSLCLSDFLKGYVRNGEELIAIPRIQELGNDESEKPTDI